MSTLFAIALAAAATTIQPDCSWDRPGANPYTGSPAAAIDRYTDIPEKVRNKLKYRIAYGNPDETVEIKRDRIDGKYAYAAAIEDMHFGAAQVCHTVSRSKWAADRVEPGAVYCADSHCILVPEICGNVSRITRLSRSTAADDNLGARGRDSELAFEDWGEHVGSYELGLIDAPEEEDLDPGRKAWRDSLAFKTPQQPQLAADDGAKRRQRTLGAGAPAAEDIPVAAVPEAETWAMMLGGLGLIGAMTRRRHRQR
jgi:hypothetical protein